MNPVAAAHSGPHATGPGLLHPVGVGKDFLPGDFDMASDLMTSSPIKYEC